MAAIFPRNPIILIIEVQNLLRRDVVDESAAVDSADDDNEDEGGGVGYFICNKNQMK